MGFFDSLFGSKRTEVSPDEMAHLIVNAAVELAVSGDDAVQDMLGSTGVVLTDVQEQAELVAYQLFLFDVIVNQVVPEYSHAVQERMRERFADLMTRVSQEAGLSGDRREEYLGFLEDRFRAYTPALRESMESEGKPEQGALALADEVLAHLGEEEDAPLQALLTIHAQWMEVFKNYPEELQEYTVVAED